MTGDPTTIDGWVILELMGHRRLAGHISEVEIAGTRFLRLTVPDADETQPPRATQDYASGAIYCITWTTEEIARKVAARSQPAPVARWELEQPAAAEEFDLDPQARF
jgi:hypothetical protein